MVNISKIVKKIKALKPIPSIIHRVLDLAENPESSMGDMVELVSYEPAITANLLKICNSASMGLNMKVDSVRQAVTLLGQQQVVELVLTQNLSTNMLSSLQGYQLAKGALWQQSVATAMVARNLSERRQLNNLAAIYTAALLKDIGKVVLSDYVAHMYRRIKRMVQKKGVSFIEAEKACIGLDHAAIGAMIARQWNFGDRMAYIIENHHMSDVEARNEPVIGAIYLADMVGMMAGTGIGVDRLAYHIYESIFSDFFMSKDELKALMLVYSGFFQGAKRLFEAA